MSNSKLVSVKDLKDEWKIDFNKSKQEIDMIFNSEYREYTERPSDYSGENFDVDKLQNICQSIEPQYIPYSSLTDIIFSMDIELDKDEEMETDFVTVIQSKVNDYILKTYKTEDIDLSKGTSQFDEITKETKAIIEIDKIEDKEKMALL